jgi:hypothetical protein
MSQRRHIVALLLESGPVHTQIALTPTFNVRAVILKLTSEVSAKMVMV